MPTRTETIKQHIDLAEYVRNCGITLTKHGRNDLKGLCPFHDDKNPSLIITPSKGLFHCPVCKAAGSVIDYAMKFHKIPMKEAVKQLSAEIPNSPLCNNTQIPLSQSEAKSEESKTLPPERSAELLERTISFYEKTFSESHEGKYYMEQQRGISDAGLFTKHRIGYANGSLLKALPKDGPILEDLETLGVLVKLDNTPRGDAAKYIERFRYCVVFPVIDVEGNVVTLYGRNCDSSQKRHLYLPDRPTGLFNVGIIKTYPEIVLVESCIDALSLEMAGMNNVVSIQSTNGLSDAAIKLFKEHEVTKTTLLMDGDKAGKDAGFELAKRLSGYFAVTSIPLPGEHDPNSYLKEYGPEKLSELFTSLVAGPEDQKTSACTVRNTGEGFEITFGLRNYEIIGLEKKPRTLKATVRVMKAGKIHVDTIDFYSSRQRRQLSQDICNAFEELPETVNSDIAKLLTLCEGGAGTHSKSGEAAGKESKTLTPEELREAREFGKSENLIENILADYEKCGLIVEESNKLLCYLAMTSRKMPEPLSVLILSSSGAGKTILQDTALSFCPPEDLVKLTSLSAKALFYKEQTSLKHKVLAIEEGAGAEEASYAIRNLISSNGLTSEVAMRDPQTGKLTTMSNTVDGPSSVFCTTTDPDVDPETKSRFLVTGIDESREQTRRILDFQKQRHGLEGLEVNMEHERTLKVHRNFQRTLKPFAVVNPHIDKLSYSDDRLQGRRAQPQYLNIINTVAFLRQMQKEIKKYTAKEKEVEYIEVDEKDIEIGHALAVEILGKTLDELSIPARDLLVLTDKMLEEKLAEIIKREGKDTATLKRDLTFTRRELREFTGWTQTRLRNHLKELIELEYLLIDSGMNGRVLQSYKLVYDGQGKDGEKFIPGVKS